MTSFFHATFSAFSALTHGAIVKEIIILRNLERHAIE